MEVQVHSICRFLFISAISFPFGLSGDVFASNESAPEILIELHYPPVVQAGETFNLRATLINPGPDSHVLVAGPGELSGTLADSYMHYSPCQHLCGSTSHYLSTGVPVLFDLGNYYVEASTLSAGTLVIQPPKISFYSPETYVVPAISPAAVPAVIQVQGPQVPETNPAMLLPSRQPLVSGKVIHDPNTGLDWLPLDETGGMDSRYLERALAPGGTLEGYRLATREEVETMLVNHLNAKGINARTYTLYQDSSEEVREALADWREWFANSGNTELISASVADTFWRRWHRLEGDTRIEGETEYYTELELWQPGPLSCGCNQVDSWPTMTVGTGRRVDTGLGYFEFPRDMRPFFLVRGGAEPQRPISEPYLYQNVLHIPAVEVQGSFYKVELNILNPVGRTLLLHRASPATHTAKPARFDPETGTVEVPDIVVISDEGEESRVSVRLRYLPMFNLEIFEAELM